MKYSLTVFIILIFFPPLRGQVNTDSLKKNWENTDLPDSIRISNINTLAWEGFLFSKPDSAYYFAQLHYEFAEQKGLLKEMAVARNTQGTSFYMLGNYARAIDYFYQSLRMKENLNDYRGIAATLNNIGMIYDEQGDKQRAIEHYTNAISNFNKIPERKMDDNQVLVASYHNLGALYVEKKDYGKALEYFNETLRLTGERKYLRERAYTFSNMGHIYLDLKDRVKSREYFNKSFEIAKRIGDENGVIDALNNFSYLYFDQKNYTDAIAYATEAIHMARRNKATGQIKDAAERLYLSHKSLGNFEKALNMYEVYIGARDSIQSDRNKEEVLRQEYEYNYERQATADSIAYAAKQQIQELKIAEQQALLDAERMQILLLYGILGLLVIVAIVGHRGYKKINAANNIIMRQKIEVEKQRDKIADQHALLEEKSHKIIDLNSNLESTVRQRTQELEKSLNQIRNYQFDLAHKIRAPFVSLVGLLNLIKDERFDSKDNKEVLEKLEDTSKRISTVLQDVSRDLNKINAER